MAWFTAGLFTNPGANTVLADSGAQPEGSFSAAIIIAATVVTRVILQRRNAANTTTIAEQSLATAANGTVIIPMMTIELLANERIRVVSTTALTGLLQASLINSK